MKIDLEELVHAGILNQPTAEAIHQYYLFKKGDEQSSRLTYIISIAGVVLVSLGLILIIGYNWDQIPKLIKLIVAFIPLFIGYALGVYTLLKRPNENLWNEISAVAILFGIGIAMALISQIYNIESQLSDFLKWWLILSIPLIYIFKAGFCSLLIWGGITWFLTATTGKINLPHTLWSLLFIVSGSIPYFLEIRKPKLQLAWSWHHWLIPFVLIIFTFSLAPYSCNRMRVIHFLGLFFIFNWFRNLDILKEKLWVQAYYVYAFIGVWVLAFVYSFKGFWSSVDHGFGDCFNGSGLVISLTFMGLFLLALIDSFRKKSLQFSDLLDFKWMIFILILLTVLGSEALNLSRLAANILILTGSGLTIYRGIKEEKLGKLNLGLVILAIWIICRFFETDISFVWRGVIFIALGILCFYLNSSLLKRKKS